MGHIRSQLWTYMARSFTKSFEAPAVAKVQFELLKQDIEKSFQPAMGGRKPAITLLGYGKIGQALANLLVQENYRVGVYDPAILNGGSKVGGITFHSSAVGAVAYGEVIFGATPADPTEDTGVLEAFTKSPQPKFVINAASGNWPKNLLLWVQHKTTKYGVSPDPLEDIEIPNDEGQSIIIKRGGRPYNFSNQAHSVPPKEIALQRALMMLCHLMLASLSEKSEYRTGLIQPCVHSQHIIIIIILEEYFKDNPDRSDLQDFFDKPCQKG